MKQLNHFSQATQRHDLEVSADFFQLSASEVLITFELQGAIESIHWPASTSAATRKDNLWQHTCFECFWSEQATPETPYTEINCSPNGNWNAYSFASYRTGMTTDHGLKVHLKNQESDNKKVKFQIHIHSNQSLSIATVGLTAVIELLNGEKTYWSLSHPGPQPDFHNKEGWIALHDAPREG